jgi:hypothetical protein
MPLHYIIAHHLSNRKDFFLFPQRSMTASDSPADANSRSYKNPHRLFGGDSLLGQRLALDSSLWCYCQGQENNPSSRGNYR